MKWVNLNAFKGHTPASFYMILSKEDFERKEAIEWVVGNRSISTFDGERLKENELIDELQSSSLFVKERVVVIRDADSLNKPILTRLEKYLESPNPTVTLILTGATFNRKTNFFKRVEEIGELLDIPEPKPYEKEAALIPKVTQWAAAAQKKMDPSTIKLFIKQLGTDQMLLHTEMEKLVCYSGDRNVITSQDIQAICGMMNQENTWQLGDALFRKETASALRIIHGLLQEGESFFTLIRQVRSQFQTKFQICSVLASGGSAADIQTQFPYMKGFVLDNNIQMAQGYGMARFKKAMIHIDEFEILAKNSSLTHELLTELLVAKLTL